MEVEAEGAPAERAPPPRVHLTLPARRVYQEPDSPGPALGPPLATRRRIDGATETGPTATETGPTATETRDEDQDRGRPTPISRQLRPLRSTRTPPSSLPPLTNPREHRASLLQQPLQQPKPRAVLTPAPPRGPPPVHLLPARPLAAPPTQAAAGFRAD
eukprot:15473061-Alexandrium_andersonii.AAC.1